MMAELNNTFGLFQELLDDFENELGKAQNLRASQAQSSLAVKAAIIGFARFSCLSEWSEQHFELISNRLQGELSLEELSWYEECAEAISVFACLSLGALLGKFQNGEIDDAGFTLADAHLAAFLLQHNENICAHYRA
jgi:hypothetical protein